MTTTNDQIQAGRTDNCAKTLTYIRPHYEVTHDKEKYTVKVHLPGVSRDKTSITIESEFLVIDGHRNGYAKPEWKVLHREIPAADYRLKLKINFPVDREQISAKSENGILIVDLPVTDSAKPRQITIQ